MIGPRRGNHRNVSGQGGSCFYRAVSYQLTEQQNRPYLDSREVASLRARARTYLTVHRDDPVPGNAALRWRDIGAYADGYAEAPIPQAMAYAIGQPLSVHVGTAVMHYGKELAGKGVKVRLVGQHYTIEY